MNYYAVRRDGEILIYKGRVPPLVEMETIDIPAREKSYNGRWKKVIARLVRMKIKGKEVVRMKEYVARTYVGSENMPISPGQVTQIPVSNHKLITSYAKAYAATNNKRRA